MNTKTKGGIPPQSMDHIVKKKNEIFNPQGKLQPQMKIVLKKEGK